jgi:hypothetical protein
MLAPSQVYWDGIAPLRSNAELVIANAPDWGGGSSPEEPEAPDVEECETLTCEAFEALFEELDVDELECEEEGEEELEGVLVAARSSGLPLYSEQSSIT